MSFRRIGRRWLASAALGTVAPLVLAQMAAPDAHGHLHDSRAAQECRKRVEEQKLPTAEERQKFMQQCVESKQPAADAAKSAAARARMGDPQSGQLHSDPPPAPATPPAP